MYELVAAGSDVTGSIMMTASHMPMQVGLNQQVAVL